MATTLSDHLWNTFIVSRILQSLLAIIGNGMTIACVIQSRTLRSPAYILITGLAMNDLLHGLTIAIVFPIKTFLTYWPVWRSACLLLQSLEAITALIEFISIFLLSTERFVALRSKLGLIKSALTVRFVVGLVVVEWVAVVALIVSLVSTTQRLKLGLPCKMSLIFPPLYMGMGVTFFLLATCATLVLYSQMGHMAWQSQRRRDLRTAAHSQPGLRQQASSTNISRKNELKVARMLGIVVGIFFLLFSPMLFMTFTIKQTSPHWQRFLYHICILLADANFWINPVIYSWRNKGFNAAFKNLFRKHFQAVIPAPGRTLVTAKSTWRSTRGEASGEAMPRPTVNVIQVAPHGEMDM